MAVAILYESEGMMMKKKIIITIVVILIGGFIYFVFPTNSTKMHNIFQEYLENNISDHNDYDECLFGLYDGSSSSGGKGYGGFGKYYEIEYCHKQHGIRLKLNTDGYDIHDNYDDVKKQIKFIEYAMEIFKENIQDNRVKIHTMSFTENEDYENTKPTKEYVQDHLEMFEPQIDLLAEDMDYEELKSIDEKINQLFGHIRTYTIVDSKNEISFNSLDLETFKEYKLNSNKKSTYQNIQCCTSNIIKTKNAKKTDHQITYLANNDNNYNETENNVYTETTEQYAYPVKVSVGGYGDARITMIYNVNRNTQNVSFHSFGHYMVRYIDSLDMAFFMKSHTCMKIKDGFMLKLTFTLMNMNTHLTSEMSAQTKITYDSIRYYNY